MPTGTRDEGTAGDVSYVLSRWLFLRGLAVVVLIAAVSLWMQISPLVGAEGLLPAGQYLEAASSRFEERAYWMLPTLCWWDASDATLEGLCAATTLFAVQLLLGIAPRLALLGVWVCYLSLSVAGQSFLSFQWDTLLLETTFCAIPFAPAGWWPRLSADQGPSRSSRWLLWLLIFKLMFLSGATKLLSGDESWWRCTALEAHYFTQPLPNWISWYAAASPVWMHRGATLFMFIVELICPWLVFCGVWGRRTFSFSTIALMVAIEVTGNFGFFNLLTAVLCVPLIDDAVWKSLLRRCCLPSPTVETQASAALKPSIWIRGRNLCHVFFVSALGLVSLLAMCDELVRSQNAEKMPVPIVRIAGGLERGVLSWGRPWILQPLRTWRTVNGYGLFRVMTTERPELVLEYSDDGETWKEITFPYKPGDVLRPPPIVAPHMPRLDWQMWFAALHPRGHLHWLVPLAEGVLKGSAGLQRLLGEGEWTGSPPRFVRYVYYRYTFAPSRDGKGPSPWWERERVGVLLGPIERRMTPEPPEGSVESAQGK